MLFILIFVNSNMSASSLWNKCVLYFFFIVSSWILKYRIILIAQYRKEKRGKNINKERKKKWKFKAHTKIYNKLTKRHWQALSEQRYWVHCEWKYPLEYLQNSKGVMLSSCCLAHKMLTYRNGSASTKGHGQNTHVCSLARQLNNESVFVRAWCRAPQAAKGSAIYGMAGK